MKFEAQTRKRFTVLFPIELQFPQTLSFHHSLSCDFRLVQSRPFPENWLGVPVGVVDKSSSGEQEERKRVEGLFEGGLVGTLLT